MGSCTKAQGVRVGALSPHERIRFSGSGSSPGMQPSRPWRDRSCSAGGARGALLSRTRTCLAGGVGGAGFPPGHVGGRLLGSQRAQQSSRRSIFPPHREAMLGPFPPRREAMLGLDRGVNVPGGESGVAPFRNVGVWWVWAGGAVPGEVLMAGCSGQAGERSRRSLWSRSRLPSVFPAFVHRCFRVFALVFSAFLPWCFPRFCSQPFFILYPCCHFAQRLFFCIFLTAMKQLSCIRLLYCKPLQPHSCNPLHPSLSAERCQPPRLSPSPQCATRRLMGTRFPPARVNRRHRRCPLTPWPNTYLATLPLLLWIRPRWNHRKRECRPKHLHMHRARAIRSGRLRFNVCR